MKKALKVVGRIILVFLALELIAFIALFVFNRVMLKKERSILETPVGQLVEVDGNNMCVYTGGEGEHTIVFLSGWGVASPIMDLRSLYELLDDDYRIVVIERFGYGYSDNVDSERSFDTIIRQDRAALSAAGIDGSYILCPHSLSGLESLLWAQTYPEEVEAIVGLDMVLPVECTDTWLDGIRSKFRRNRFLCRTGGFRLMNIDVRLDAFKTGTLTEEEKDIYRALVYAKTGNDSVKNELEDIQGACSRIEAAPMPDIPMLMFIMDSKVEEMKYASEQLSAEVVPLSCGHYVHNIMQEEISGDMKEFIEESVV